MKKIITFVLGFVIVLTFVGCSDKKKIIDLSSDKTLNTKINADIECGDDYKFKGIILGKSDKNILNSINYFPPTSTQDERYYGSISFKKENNEIVYVNIINHCNFY